MEHVLEYDDGILGKVRDVKEYILSQIGKDGNSEWNDTLEENTKDLIRLLDNNKEIDEDTLIYVEDCVMGGFTANVVNIEKEEI